MAVELDAGTVVGGYRIERVAGRGGMGVVYRATQIALERTVALKLIAPEVAGEEDFRNRFTTESRLLAQLDHPNVVTVHEAGEHEGVLYIAMRFVDGTDLRELLAREGALAPERAADLVAQVGRALDAAHARGLVHRDVKPANVLIEERPEGEHAYLTDFGLTKLIEASTGGLTASGQWVGTVDFVAPEQIEGKRVDARTDVYALGCVLYTALTGRVPYERDTQAARLFAHLQSPVPSVRESVQGVPQALDDAISRAMAKDPADRFQSAGDLGRAAVAAARGDEAPERERPVGAGAAAPPPPTARPAAPSPDPAPPAKPLEPAAPGRSRRGLPVAVAALVALAVVAGAVLALSGGGSDGGENAAVEAKTLEASAVEVGSAPAAVAAGEGGVWVANEGSSGVMQVSEDGEAGEPISTDGNPRTIAVGEGGVWVLTVPDRVLRRVDPETRQPGRPIDLPDGEGTAQMAAGEGAVWITDPDSSALSKVSPTGGRTQRIEMRYGMLGPVATGGGKVWVLGADDEHKRQLLQPVDAATGEVGRPIPAGPMCPGGVAFGEGSVWVGNCKSNAVHRIDPGSLRTTARIPVESGVGGSTDPLAVGGGAVWVLEPFGGGDVARIDPATNRVIGPSTSVDAVEVSNLAVSRDAAWVTNLERDSLIRLGFRR